MPLAPGYHLGSSKKPLFHVQKSNLNRLRRMSCSASDADQSKSEKRTLKLATEILKEENGIGVLATVTAVQGVNWASRALQDAAARLKGKVLDPQAAAIIEEAIAAQQIDGQAEREIQTAGDKAAVERDAGVPGNSTEQLQGRIQQLQLALNAVREELTTKERQLRATATTLDQVLSSAQEASAELESAQRQYVQDVKALEERVALAEKTMDVVAYMEEDLAASNAEVSRLTLELEAAQSWANEQHQERQGEREAHAAAVSSLQKQLAAAQRAAQQAAEEHKRQLAAMEMQFEAAEEAARYAAEGARHQVADLQRQLAAAEEGARASAEDDQRRITALQEQLAVAQGDQRQVETLRAELASAEDAVGMLQRQLQELGLARSTEVAVLREQLLTAQAAAEQAQHDAWKAAVQAEKQLKAAVQEAERTGLEELARSTEQLHAAEAALAQLQQQLEAAVASRGEQECATDAVLSEKDGELEALRRQLSDARAVLRRQEDDLARAQEAVAEAQDANWVLTAQAEASAAKHAREVQGLKEEGERKAAAAATNILKLQEGIAELQAEERNMQSRLESLQEQLQNQASSETEAAAALRIQLASATEELATAMQLVQAAEAEGAASREELEQVQGELQGARQAVQELERKLSALRSEKNTDIGAALAAAERAEKQLAAVTKQKDAELSAARAAVTTANQECKKLEQQLEDLAAAEAQRDQELSAAQAQLASAQRDYQLLEKQLEEMAAAEADLQARLDVETEASVQLAAFEAEQEELARKKDAELADAQAKLVAAEAHIQGLQQQVSEMGSNKSEEWAATQQDLHTARVACAKLEGQLTELAAAKDAEVAAAQAELAAQKEAALAAIRQVLARSEKQLVELAAGKEAALAAAQAELAAQQEAALAAVQQVMAKSERQVAELVAGKDAEVAAAQAELTVQKDAALSAVRQVLAKLDAQVASLAAEKDAALAAMQAQLTAVRAELEIEKDAVLVLAQAELEARGMEGMGVDGAGGATEVLAAEPEVGNAETVGEVRPSLSAPPNGIPTPLPFSKEVLPSLEPSPFTTRSVIMSTASRQKLRNSMPTVTAGAAPDEEGQAVEGGGQEGAVTGDSELELAVNGQQVLREGPEGGESWAQGKVVQKNSAYTREDGAGSGPQSAPSSFQPSLESVPQEVTQGGRHVSMLTSPWLPLSGGSGGGRELPSPERKRVLVERGERGASQWGGTGAAGGNRSSRLFPPPQAGKSGSSVSSNGVLILGFGGSGGWGGGQSDGGGSGGGGGGDGNEQWGRMGWGDEGEVYLGGALLLIAAVIAASKVVAQVKPEKAGSLPSSTS